MNTYWTLPVIAHKLTSNHRSRIITEETLLRWIREGKLNAERITGNERGHGKYALQVEEKQLKTDLAEIGYDVDALFPKSE